MKKTLVAVLAALTLAGCTTSNSYGKCIGVVDTPKPGVEYSLSTWNLVLAFIFSETIIVPGVVVLFEVKCPAGPAAK